MKYYVNTDTVDIAARSIGVHPVDGPGNRCYCVQVRHNGTREGVATATKLAALIADALNNGDDK